METDIPPSSARPAKRVLPAVARYVMGIPLFIFGLNTFFNFIPQPKTPIYEGAMAFAGALMKSGYMMRMSGVTFLVVALCLSTYRFVPLALALFAPFMVNSILFHSFLEHTGLPMSIVFLALELYLAWSYRSAYRSMLAARVSPG